MKKSMFFIILFSVICAPFCFAQKVNTTPVGKVLDTYFTIKNSLVSDNAAKAQSAAKSMLFEIQKADMSKMSGEQHNIWMQYLKKLSYDTQHISETTDIDHQREHFITLSKNMYAIVKVFPSSTPVYYQYCPMANDNKGAYWLSEQEKIHNPYYGDKMNTCPSTKETIVKK